MVEGRTDLEAVAEDIVEFGAGLKFDMRTQILAAALLVIANGCDRNDHEMRADRDFSAQREIGVNRSFGGEESADRRLQKEEALGKAELQASFARGVIMQEIESAEAAGDCDTRLGLRRWAADQEGSRHTGQEGRPAEPPPHLFPRDE